MIVIFNHCSYLPYMSGSWNSLNCMLVFKSLHGLAPAYLLNEFSHARDLTRAIEICSVCCKLGQLRTRFSGAKIWNTLPLALRSEHDLNKFGFGLKKHFRSKPNWAFDTFAMLSCSIFFSCYCFLCCFFFSPGPHIQTNLTNWAPPTNYSSK